MGKKQKGVSKGKSKILDSLTQKQAAFVQAYTAPDSPTQLDAQASVLATYETTNKNTAAVLGCNLLKKTVIQQTIRDQLGSEDLWDDIREGLCSVLRDKDHTRYKNLRDYAEFTRIWGDLSGLKSPDKQIIMTLTPEDRKKEYEELNQWLKLGTPEIKK